MTFLKYVLCFLCLCCVVDVHAQQTDDLFNFSKKREEALVVKVVNADIIVLEDGQRIKLIGVEAIGPLPKHYVKYDEKGKPIEPTPEENLIIPIEEQAFAYARSLLENKKVKLEYDVSARSPDGYRWAYVTLPDGRMANVEMLRMGFVRLRIVPPNLKHVDQLRDAYQESRREKRGLASE